MPSFGNGLADLSKKPQGILIKGVTDEAEKETGRLGKAYKWLARWAGEKQSQLINALFTTTLAPLMIAYNPFSEQDKKTKEYTALRQPISAGIALAVTLPMTILLDNFLDDLYNVGHFETIDLRPEPGSGYLKRAYKKSAEKKQGISFKDYADQIKKERKAFFSSLLTADPKDINFDESSKTISVKGKTLPKVPGFETKEALEKYLKANNLHNRTFRDFLADRFKFEFCETGEFKPQVTKIKLNQVKAMDFLKEMGLIEDGKVTQEELKKLLASYQQSGQIPALRKALNSGTEVSEEGFRGLLKVIGIVSSRTSQMASNINLEQLFHHLGLDDKLEELKDKSMAEVLDTFKQLFEGKLTGFKKDADIANFAENFLKNAVKRMAENSKNYKKWAGIGFNLITTAVSCTILNWAYPRIVERLFPNLVKSDKSPEALKGGTK